MTVVQWNNGKCMWFYLPQLLTNQKCGKYTIVEESITLTYMYESYSTYIL